MSSKSEQSNPVAVAEKRKPVTVAQCVFNIVLYGAYSWALVRFALHHSGANLVLFGLLVFSNFVLALVWISNLRRIRNGDRAEYVFTPIEKHESMIKILLDRFFYTGIAILVTVASIYLLRLLGPTSYAGGATILLANLATWRGAYHAWTRDRAYKSEPKVKFASEEAAEQAKALEKAQKVPVAVGANVERPVGHWWTDTPLREENKQRLGR